MKVRLSRAAFAAVLFFAVMALAAFALPQTTNAAGRTEDAAITVQADYGVCTVRVQRGEALYIIAARHRTTTAYLAQLNNLWNPNYIYTGMVLKVPCAQPQPLPQPLPYPQPQPLPQPQPQPYPICAYYTVQRGDWLKTIAAHFGVSWQLLAQVNGLQNANYIYAGQKLAIPCPQPYPPAPPPPPVCPGCPPCQGCPPVYPTPTPVPPTPAPVMNMVEIHNNFFAPPVITVHVGQFVMWANRGNQVHTVTQGLCPNGQCTPTPGGFNSGPLVPGATFVCQFTQLGTFAYFDATTGVGATVAVVP